MRDTKWQSGFLRIAKVNHCPILSVYLDAQKSAFFYNIAKNRPGVFSIQNPIAMPEERRELRMALKAECGILGHATLF